MAVKIRLSRRGRKKLAMYDIVVADARSPRDGKFIEKLGTYNPNTNPASITLNVDGSVKWLMTGAQPTDTARAILAYKGVLIKKHLQVGVNKGAISQEVADEKFAVWATAKDAKISAKKDGLSDKKDATKKSQLEAEAKKNTARADAIAKKYQVEEAPVEVVAEEAVEAAEAVVTETPAETAE